MYTVIVMIYGRGERRVRDSLPSFPSIRGELSETAPISECEGHKQYYILLERINFLRFLLSHKIHPEESVPTPFYLHRSKIK
jgi:hypothetical protein